MCLQALSEYPGDILTGEGVVTGGGDEGGIAVFLDVLLLAATLGDGHGQSERAHPLFHRLQSLDGHGLVVLALDILYFSDGVLGCHVAVLSRMSAR